MTKAEKLAQELRECGLKRMAQAAEDEVYSDDRDTLMIELRFALTLKSLSAKDVGRIGRLFKRVEDGEFH